MADWCERCDEDSDKWHERKQITAGSSDGRHLAAVEAASTERTPKKVSTAADVCSKKLDAAEQERGSVASLP